jgi:hypothetical protein
MVMKDELNSLADTITGKAVDLLVLVHELHRIRKDKAILEKRERDLMPKLKPLVDPTFDKDPKSYVIAGDIALERTQGTSRTILADLLLAQGISPERIANATRTSTFFQYRIKEVKET